MRFLLTGKNGQVGFELQRALAPLGEIIAVDHAACDLADPAAIRYLLAEVRPDIVINPAAYTAVDKAESEPALAYAVNATAPGVFGEALAKTGGLVIHYSTDYVFDGKKGEGYGEDDQPNPQSIYGKSKLAGERALQASGAHYLIFRTSWVFGAHGANFAKTMLRLAAEKDNLNVVTDQYGAPTSAALLADVTAQVIGRYQRQGSMGFPFGLYHLVAAGVTTWHEYAKAVIQAAIASGRPVRLCLEDVRGISTAEYPLPAPRPANSRLETKRLQEAFGLVMPPWQAGLHHVLQQIL